MGATIKKDKSASEDSKHDPSEDYQGFRHVATLDGWRAIAVIGAISYHSLNHGVPRGWPARFALHGNLGVDLFFAISGFLICGKLLNEFSLTHTISLRRFYLRRFFRIMPPLWAYLAVLALLSLVGWISVKRWEFESSLFFVRNYFPTYSGVALGQYTGHLWSLAVEEHFYLLAPITLMYGGLKRRRLAIGLLIAALSVSLWRFVDNAQGWLLPYAVGTGEKTDTRIDALLWGCLAAFVYPAVVRWARTFRWRNLWLPLLLVLAAAVSYHAPALHLLEAFLFPVLLMSTAAFPDSWLSRLLEWRFLRWIGRLSYSLYLWQELATFRPNIPHSPLTALQVVPLNLILLVVCACASYYLVEKPAIRWGRSLETPSPGILPVTI